MSALAHPILGISYPTISQQDNGHGLLGLQKDYIDRLQACWYFNVNVIKQKCRGKLLAGVLLSQNNATVHKTRVAQAAIRNSKFE